MVPYLSPWWRQDGQPKLELFGLYKALWAFRLYLIGVKNLVIKVDAKYIKGMLETPDLQPNATMNQWIQGILLFDFVLKHVPGTTHLAADALSCQPPAEEEDRPEEGSDDRWLDNVALYIGKGWSQGQEMGRYPEEILPSVVATSNANWEDELEQIWRFLTTLEAPDLTGTQEQK